MNYMESSPYFKTSAPASADQPLFWGFLALLVWAPMPLGSNRVWSISILTASALALLLGWLWLYTRNRVQLTPTSKRAWPIIALLVTANGWLGVQLSPVGFTLSAADTAQEFLQGWGLIALFVLALVLLSSQQRIRWTIYTVVASGAFQAVYGSLMTLSGTEFTFLIPKDSYKGLATGTFINRNHLAGYLVICLSLGIGMMIASLKSTPSGTWRNRLRRWMTALLGAKARLRIALVILVIGLVLTHSRMGNSSFFIAMTFTGIVALVLGRKANRSTIILLSSLLVIDIFIVGTFFGVEKVIDRLENTSSQRETRDEVDQYSLGLLNNHLLDGSGAGTFYTSFPEYRGYEIRTFYDHAHNDYIEFLSERGVIGMIPLLLVILATYIAAFWAQWKRRNPLMRGLSFGCIMSMTAMALHATVDFNLQIPANAATFMLVLALGWISLFHKKEKGGT